MLDQINELAKALPQKATLLTVSQDVYDRLNSSFFPKELPSYTTQASLKKIYTENGELDINIIDGANILQVT